MAQSLYQGNAEPTAQVFRKGTDAYIDGSGRTRTRSTSRRPSR